MLAGLEACSTCQAGCLSYLRAQMPRNNQLEKILFIGSGPIVIGQGCEFDYSGVQACKALREEGYQVVLVNSNPATIMTDPEFADRTYVEPITPEVIEAIMEREKPDAILPTLGRTNRAQCRDGIKPQRRAGAARRQINWRERAGDRKRRRPPIVQGSDVAHRSRRAAFGRSAFTCGSRSHHCRDRNISADHSSCIYLGRHWRRDRLQPRRTR